MIKVKRPRGLVSSRIKDRVVEKCHDTFEVTFDISSFCCILSLPRSFLVSLKRIALSSTHSNFAIRQSSTCSYKDELAVLHSCTDGMRISSIKCLGTGSNISSKGGGKTSSHCFHSSVQQ